MLRRNAMQRLQAWPKHELIHIAGIEPSADRLASSALQQGTCTIVTSYSEIQDLISLNRLEKLIIPETADRVVKISAITRSTLQRRRRPEVLHEEAVQDIQVDRTK